MAYRILIVEDDVTFRQAVTDFLEQDLDIITASTLNEGLEIVKTKPIDCLILDLCLPDSSYFNTVNKIKDLAKYTCVIVLTGREGRELLEQSLQFGAKGFIYKPDIADSIDTLATDTIIPAIESYKRTGDLDSNIQNLRDSTENLQAAKKNET